MTVDQVRDTVRSQIKVGMEVKKDGKIIGRVTEVCADGCVIYRLQTTKYAGSDERDDAAVAAGTKLTRGVIDMADIATGLVVVGSIKPSVNDRWELI